MSGQQQEPGLNVRFEAFTASIAFVITGWFLLFPSPPLMAAFVFVAQPIFLMIGVKYLFRVLRELRSKGVL